MTRLAALLLLSACQHRAPITSCDDNVHGVYVTPAGTRWMVLDNGPTLEAYPLFDDSVPGGAPQVIDLHRDGARLSGEIRRRFMLRDVTCDARATIHVTTCRGADLQVVLGDVAPPVTYSPCTWPQQQPTHVETWHRD